MGTSNTSGMAWADVTDEVVWFSPTEVSATVGFMSRATIYEDVKLYLPATIDLEQLCSKTYEPAEKQWICGCCGMKNAERRAFCTGGSTGVHVNTPVMKPRGSGLDIVTGSVNLDTDPLVAWAKELQETAFVNTRMWGHSFGDGHSPEGWVRPTVSEEQVRDEIVQYLRGQGSHPTTWSSASSRDGNSRRTTDYCYRQEPRSERAATDVGVRSDRNRQMFATLQTQEQRDRLAAGGDRPAAGGGEQSSEDGRTWGSEPGVPAPEVPWQKRFQENVTEQRIQRAARGSVQSQSSERSPDGSAERSSDEEERPDGRPRSDPELLERALIDSRDSAGSAVEEAVQPETVEQPVPLAAVPEDAPMEQAAPESGADNKKKKKKNHKSSGQKARAVAKIVGDAKTRHGPGFVS